MELSPAEKHAKEVDEERQRRAEELLRREEEKTRRGQDLVAREEEKVRREQELLQREEELVNREHEEARRQEELARRREENSSTEATFRSDTAYRSEMTSLTWASAVNSSLVTATRADTGAQPPAGHTHGSTPNETHTRRSPAR